MNKQSIRLLLIVVLATVLIPELAEGRRKKNKKGIPAAPETEEGYTSLPFKKIINPAFIEDVKGKWIRANVRFIRVSEQVIDMPAEYRKDWVRIWIGDLDDALSQYLYAAIPKEESDLVFELKQGEPVEILAYLQPVVKTSGITGQSSRHVLFRISSVKRISEDQ